LCYAIQLGRAVAPTSRERAFRCSPFRFIFSLMILKTYARVFTTDLAAALPLYQQLVGREPDLQFAFGEWELVALGDLLLIGGTTEALAPIRGSHGPLVVDDLVATQHQLTQAGAVITQPISPTPTGTMLYARHADGTVMEYVQWTPDLVKRIIG